LIFVENYLEKQMFLNETGKMWIGLEWRWFVEHLKAVFYSHSIANVTNFANNSIRSGDISRRVRALITTISHLFDETLKINTCVQHDYTIGIVGQHARPQCAADAFQSPFGSNHVRMNVYSSAKNSSLTDFSREI